MLRASQRHASRQQGVVLLLAIIVLVALTIGALALSRSVYTTNVIAGNIAFQRSAAHATERGLAAAMKWLEDNQTLTGACTGGTLKLHCTTQAEPGYLATRELDRKTDEGWLQFWDGLSKVNGIKNASDPNDKSNVVSYVIQRMCAKQGDATNTDNTCTVPPIPTSGTCSSGSSCSAGEANLASAPLVYYRITVMVEGPRKTRSLAQAMMAL